MMKKVLLLLLMAISFAATAQNYTIANPLKLNSVPVGTENDSVLMYSNQKVVKHLPLSEIKVPTNIDYLAAPSGGIIFSSTGTDASIPLGTTTNAGLMDPADKIKLNGLDTALDLKINLSEKAAANGVATLGADGKVPNSQIPALAISETFPVASQAAMLALSTAEQGDVAVRTDISKSFILTQSPASTLANWQELLTPTDAVQSVNGQTGNVSLTTGDISDSTNKRYQTDAQNSRNDATSSIQTQLNNKADKSGATFTGIITAPEFVASSETANTIASFDAFKQVKSLTTTVYPSLNELVYVKGVTSAIQTQLNSKAPLASPTFTGTVSGITATMVGLGNVDNTSDVNKPVSTAQQTALDLKANIDNATFTGTTNVVGLTASGKVTWGTATATAGSIANSSTDGAVLRSKTGSTNDFVLKNGTGIQTLRIPTGTTNVVIDGDISAPSAHLDTILTEDFYSTGDANIDNDLIVNNDATIGNALNTGSLTTTGLVNANTLKYQKAINYISGDFNSLTTPGFYEANDMTHDPYGYNAGQYLVTVQKSAGADYIVQTATYSDTMETFIRQWTGTWTNWTKYAIVGGTSSQFLKGDGSIDTNSYVKYIVQNSTASSTLTGTTTETILSTNQISLNKFLTTDIMNISFTGIKTGVANTVTINIYTNTTNSLSGATKIATWTPGSNSLFNKMRRTFALRSGNLTGASFTTSGITDEFTGLGSGTPSSTTFNTAITNYIIVTATLADTGDSFYQSTLSITN